MARRPHHDIAQSGCRYIHGVSSGVYQRASWYFVIEGGELHRNQDLEYLPWGTEWDPRNANTVESGINRSTAVGMYPHGLSPFGILDLSGNVWEWCINEYESPRELASARDQPRVVRGGSWQWTHDFARLARRDRELPGYRSRDHGFRVACSLRFL